MAQTIDMEAIRKLSPAERMALINQIWDTIADDDREVEVSAPAMAEMNRRLEEMKQDPSKSRSLEEVKRFLRSRSGR